MIKELSYLPVWYADPEDFVFTEEIVSPRFFSLQPKEFRPFAKLISRKEIENRRTACPKCKQPPGDFLHIAILFLKNCGKVVTLTLRSRNGKKNIPD